MASDNPVFINGKTAAGDISSYQYYLVKRGTGNDIAVCSGATDIPIGVLYDKPDADGEPAQVAALAVGHKIKVKVGAAGVTATWVGTDASGLLVDKDTDKQYAIGVCTQSWDSGDIAIVEPAPGFLAV